MINVQKKLPIISDLGVTSIVLFVVLSFIGRFLFPWGDEPDFRVRATEIIYSDMFLPRWVPYNIFANLVNEIRPYSSCKVDSSPFALWAYIDPVACIGYLDTIITRTIITIIVALPVLLLVTFRRYFFDLAKVIGATFSYWEWERRLDAISLSLLFPSIIYYLGLLSVEQLTLVISILIVTLVESIIGSLLLFYLVFTLDIGNSIVVAVFLVLTYSAKYIGRLFGLKHLFFVILAFLTTIYITSISLLAFLIESNSFLPAVIVQEIRLTLASITTSEYVDKYPIILRPAITYMSFIFNTPANIKSVFLYVAIGVLILYSIYSIIGKYKQLTTIARHSMVHARELIGLKTDIVYALSSITTILFFVLMLPTYANAKYYIFTLPFFLQLALAVFPRWKVFLAVNIITVTLFVNLILMMIRFG